MFCRLSLNLGFSDIFLLLDLGYISLWQEDRNENGFSVRYILDINQMVPRSQDLGSKCAYYYWSITFPEVGDKYMCVHTSPSILKSMNS